MKNGEAFWTLDELTRQVESALAEGYEGAASGRVRDIPDRRTIRYYTTLGLIDRPAAMRGRTALYGRRHLLQLVAIKKLQAGGGSLAEIQQALTGQSDSELARVAGERPRDAAEPGPPSGPREERAFWRQEPTPHQPPAPSAREEVPPETFAGGNPVQALRGIPLHPGVTLLLATTRPIDVQQFEEIRSAALPLIDHLTRSQLIEPREGG